MTAASVITNRAARILLDQTNARFTVTELMLWISEAQRQIVQRRPDAYVTVGNVTILQDKSEQTLPVGAVRLLDAICNKSITVPLDAVSLIHRSVMDNNDRTWFGSASASLIKHIVYDDRTPLKYWVFPRPDVTAAANGLVLAYTTVPAELTATTDALLLDDIYISPMLDWVLYRCLSKIGPLSNQPELGNPALAERFREAFEATMGAKAASDMTNSPAWANYPRNPNAPPLTGAAGGNAA